MIVVHILYILGFWSPNKIFEVFQSLMWLTICELDEHILMTFDIEKYIRNCFVNVIVIHIGQSNITTMLHEAEMRLCWFCLKQLIVQWSGL